MASPARSVSGEHTSAERSSRSSVKAMASFCSTATIMQPSPSHLAMRTPRSEATSRTMVRNALRRRPAASSPKAAV